MKRIIFSSIALAILIATGGDGIATDATPLSSVAFYGRWDLRAPDRAIAVNPGSYIRAQFSGTSIGARFDTSLNQPPIPTIVWRIDKGDWQESEVAAKVKLADNLAAGPHTLWLMFRGAVESQSRWNSPLTASLTFLGLDLPSDGKILPPLDAWIHPKLTIEFLGDSITEGVLVQGDRPTEPKAAWSTDAPLSYSSLTAQLLGAEWRQVGFGALGVIHGGNGGVPPALDAFNFFHDGCPRDNWQPDLVIINQGTNENALAPDIFQPAYVKYLAEIRQAYPKAKIAAMRPFFGFQDGPIRAAVSAARAAGDKSIYYIDTTNWYAGNLHPGAADGPGIADKLAAVLRSEVIDDSGN